MIDRQMLLDKLMPENKTDEYADKILAVNPALHQTIEDWVVSDKLAEDVVQDYSMKSLVEENGLKPGGAILMLDWLMRDPEEAKKALNHHDNVTY